MARPIDPERHRARRLQIIDAAITVIAQRGYAGATTAAICAEAGIGSGTFFHYFPAKRDLVVAILAEGASEMADFFAARGEPGSGEPGPGAGPHRARQVIVDYVHHVLADLRDPRTPGFIAAMGALIGDEQIAAALTAEDEVARAHLVPWVRQAQADGQVRADLSPSRVVEWVLLLVDGLASRLQGPVDISEEEPMLMELLDAFLFGPEADSDGVVRSGQ